MLKNFISTIAFLLITGFTAHAQEFSFKASVDRNEITTGEPVRLTLALVYGASASDLTTPDLKGLTVLQGPMESNNVVNINGRMSRSYSRTWYVTATQPGTYVIGPSSVRVGDRTLQTEAITINVSSSASILPNGHELGPSLSAFSGFGCVSANRPEMPTATAARASTGTNSR